MTKANVTTTVLVSAEEKGPFDQAQMAAVAYLARYSGRTLETYRYDVRVFFQWCADVGLAGGVYRGRISPDFDFGWPILRPSLVRSSLQVAQGQASRSQAKV